ncbi:MAG: RagB/SusD family nutrient uptake outer membrane protein [Chitinophagaceae bacterium]|jgi:tetratricopeptide (TPR) repeat protein|nr:RagB/SusD family nutrient uptake outer membrane protein [Chitinophagaceae bacterium]
MNFLKYILVLIVATVLLASCDKHLEVTNPNSQTSADFWKTESDIAEGVVATYNILLIDGTFNRTLPALVDVRGDDVNSQSPWTIYPLTANFTVQADYAGGYDVESWIWRDFYQLIAKANLVFYNAPNIQFSDQNYKNRLLGQAYFLRALAYYEIAQNYQVCPLVLTKPLDQSQYFPATASQDSIWASIESDLQNAQSMLPQSYDNVSGPDQGQKGRATWGAATGLLGKAYMIRGDYTKAAAEFKQIIDAGIYKLVPNYGDNFTMSNENNSESLFEIQFGNFGVDANWVEPSVSSWTQGSALDFPYGMTQFGAWGDIHGTQWLYSEFKKERCKDGTLDPRLYWTLVTYEKEYDSYTDGRSNTIFGTQSYLTGVLDSTNTNTNIPNTIYIAKNTYARIPGHTLEGDGKVPNSGINYRFMRYSEILLLYAEALNELNGSSADVYSYIQMVRDRANLPDLATTNPGMTQDQIRDQLAHERALEFGIENIRFFDIMRWKWLYNSTKLAELKSHDAEFNTWVSGHEYLPVPQGELDTNPNLTGNSAN